MLVLSRHLNEAVIIGGNIVVRLLEIRGENKIRLGIEAPADVTVHREEVQRAIEAKEGDHAPEPQ